MIKVSELENVDEVIQKTLTDMGGNVKQRVNCVQIFNRWKDFVDDDEEIFPVELKGGILTLYSSSPMLNDKYKFLLPELIEKINISFNEKIVTKIIFGKSFKTPRLNVEKNLQDEEIDDEEIILTDKEIDDCRKKADLLKTPEMRDKTFNMLVAQTKDAKWKLNHGWHKCEICEKLCKPSENLCATCQVTEQNKMMKAIREIFISKPYSSFKDVQKKIVEKMPHMKKLCTPAAIDAARMDLILQTAARLPSGETDSPRAKFFVMLVRQLREEDLTAKIIEQTLYEFRFDLAERPSIPMRSLRTIKKSSRKKKV